MKNTTGMRKPLSWASGLGLGLMLGAVSPAALAQAYDFAELARPVDNPSAQTSLRGFRSKAATLSDAVVGDETGRTRQREADSRARDAAGGGGASLSSDSSDSRSGGSGSGSGSQRSAGSYTCKFKCTNVGSSGSPWQSLGVSATSTDEARNRVRDAAQKQCWSVFKMIVDTGWGIGCEKK